MKTLTVFTPTYNRKHTLLRTFESLCRQTCKDFEWLIIDDGSTDETIGWVKSLGIKVQNREERYDWMGRLTENPKGENFTILVHLHEDEPPFFIHYIYKENGGLYTGYNVAYSYIETELCVCIDSDDYMPDDAVEKVLKRWKARPHTHEYCGIVGLDFNVVDGKPIGGYFPAKMSQCNELELSLRNIHHGDTKEVMRVDLMKKVSPMTGFKGEKDFNPWYMIMQVIDKYPMLVINDNLCWVEYQIGKDSMSQGIWTQYINSPQSYAKYRIMAMSLKHNTWSNRFRICVHYVSSCIIAKKKDWLKASPFKVMTLLVAPLSFLLTLLIFYKNKKVR